MINGNQPNELDEPDEADGEPDDPDDLEIILAIINNTLAEQNEAQVFRFETLERFAREIQQEISRDPLCRSIIKAREAVDGAINEIVAEHIGSFFAAGKTPFRLIWKPHRNLSRLRPMTRRTSY